jgi:hypothetical protein
VLRVWPRFLQEAERISKMTRVMMDTAVPTGTGGKTITITFRDRANHAMMDKPRNLEFVRKLLARCLDRDSVQVRFLLDTDAAPPPPPPSRTKAASRDRLAQWDAEPLATSAAAAVPPADDDAFTSAPFPQAPSVSVAAPPPSAAPSRSAFAPGAGRAAGSAAPAPPREVSPPRAQPATTVASRGNPPPGPRRPAGPGNPVDLRGRDRRRVKPDKNEYNERNTIAARPRRRDTSRRSTTPRESERIRNGKPF